MIIVYKSATFTRTALGCAVLALVTGLSLTREIKAQLPAEGVSIPASATITTEPPTGWMLSGVSRYDYVAGVDPTESRNGSPSAYVKSIKPTARGSGGMMQHCIAENYRGKRLRLSAWMKSATTKATWANEEGANLDFRTNTAPGSKGGVGFHDMNSRPIRIKDTTEWQEYSLLLDVPADATMLNYGFFLEGAGQIWVSGFKIEEVGPVPPDHTLDMAKKVFPLAPVNRGFN